MGAEATQWQMFQQISLYNKKLGQNCRKGCFLKKHTDFKEMSCGICNIYRAVPAEGRGLQARRRVMRWWELAAGTGTTSGLQQAGQDILKELLWCLKLWFHRAKAGGEDRLHSRAHVFWLTKLAPQSLQRATLSCRTEWTLLDNLSLSTGLSLWAWPKVRVGSCCKEYKIRNI